MKSILVIGLAFVAFGSAAVAQPSCPGGLHQCLLHGLLVG